MLDKLRAWVVEAEDRMSQTEALPISNNIEDLEQQLASHEVHIMCVYVCVHNYVCGCMWLPEAVECHRNPIT